MNTVTFSRVANGEFVAMINGVATEWTITNGSMGLSGTGRNEYLISNGSKTVNSGITLQKAKKLITKHLEKTAQPVALSFEEEYAQGEWVAEDPVVYEAREQAILARIRANRK